jgi:hypothetical protein
MNSVKEKSKSNRTDNENIKKKNMGGTSKRLNGETKESQIKSKRFFTFSHLVCAVASEIKQERLNHILLNFREH